MKLFSPHTLGIDISDRSIEALELKTSGKELTLVASSRQELPEGIVEDGIINDQSGLSKYLTAIMEQARPKSFTSRTVAFSLPESRTMQHLFFFPQKFTPKQIREALPFEAEKVIPFETDNSPWDFQILGTEGTRVAVNYAVAPRKLIDQYVEVFQSVRLKPVICELESQALVRSLTYQYTAGSISALLDIGARTTDVIMRDEFGVRFTLSIPVAGNHFTKAIAEHLNISLGDAESKKIKSGFTLKEIRTAVAPLCKLIIDGADKATTFIEQKTKKKILELVLCGGSALLPGITEYFQERIDCPVRIGDPWKGISVKKPPEPSLLYSTVIGLAMRGAREAKTHSINFLSPYI